MIKHFKLLILLIAIIGLCGCNSNSNFYVTEPTNTTKAENATENESSDVTKDSTLGKGDSDKTITPDASNTKSATDSSNISYSDSGWMYYINENDSYKIYKKKSDDTNQTKICDDERVITISLIDGWVYYTILDEEDGVPRLYKIQVDGSSRQAVCDVDFLGDPSQEEIYAEVVDKCIIFQVKPLKQPTINDSDKKSEDERVKSDTHKYEVSIDGKTYKELK